MLVFNKVNEGNYEMEDLSLLVDAVRFSASASKHCCRFEYVIWPLLTKTALDYQHAEDMLQF